ncbi:Mur ligase family protein [Staphylococcus felis]|uniref:Uncharacterized protein n=1 Tax=Staphylococcus felis TaxID=46127 RepID=A0A3E0IM12_9STAP|nr:Mur ligase family protein [Staphylococcus felis]REH81738.1 hypothetical protein DOS61_10540 [Staphylococcus felis]REH91161.1 hypothetical protein DOS83_11730 [Staphylococcus felis]
MYKVKDIYGILDAKIISGEKNFEKEINDFEYQAKYIRNDNTAFVSISKSTWSKWLGKEAKILDGRLQILNSDKKPALVITDQVILGLDSQIPQLLVEDSIEAMRILGDYFRSEFKNPVIAITGSMGKSSTRMMIVKALKGYKVVENRGNANTRVPVLLNLCKLVKKPDYAVYEMSINSLNNRGNLSLIVKPDITVVTGIGEAHLSTIKSTEEIALFKSRIFEGQSKDGIAVINEETKHSDILQLKAKENLNKVIKYGQSSDENVNISEQKGYLKVEIQVDGENHVIPINIISEGMMLNIYATINVLKHLKVDLIESINHLTDFKPFKKVLEIKEINTSNLQATIIDDTHNASLPAMINAIKTFNKQSEFYTGNKVLVLGKISDLGKSSERQHSKLVSQIEESKANYILCIDNEMRKVVNKVKKKNITWYNNPEQLLIDLKYLVDEDSLILFKSSVTGTMLPQIATRAFHDLYYMNGVKEIDYYKQFPVLKGNVYLDKNNKIISMKQQQSAVSMEGLTPLIYYIYCKNEGVVNKKVKLRKWPTNNAIYFEGRELELNQLIDAMINKPHPSLIYQLAYEVFENENKRRLLIDNFINDHNLSLSSSVNVTGRYRSKERQSFNLNDLEILYMKYKDILFANQNYVILGDRFYHGMIKDEKEGVLIFIMYDSLESLISSILNNIR